MPRLTEQQSTPDALPRASASTSAPASASASASARHDAHRAKGVWRVAVNATKGLFTQTARAAPEDPAPMPPAELRRKRVRRSLSSPSLRKIASESRLNLSADFAPAPLPFLNAPSSSLPSARKAKPAPLVGRPIISSPSLPQHLDNFDFPHPKLSYPLSPMPSPVDSTFGAKTPLLQSSSKLPTTRSVSDDDKVDSFKDLQPVRRRTKSAPGVKLGKRTPFSPGLSTAPEDDSSPPPSPMMVIDYRRSIASPSTEGSLPSPSLETPKLPSDYFTNITSPVVHAASPRSFTSVKRKPVPRYLYTDPPDHEPSAPCTPFLTPVPGSPPSSGSASGAVRNADANPMHTPLLSSSELILKSCDPSRVTKRGLALLPIGQQRLCGSARGQHRRSVSENVRGYTPVTPLDGLGIPSPWFTTNDNGAITPLLTPAEEYAPFSLAAEGLNPPPPRTLPQSPPRTPLPRAFDEHEHSSVSDNTFPRSLSSRSGALSPLTDEEIEHLRSFLRQHPTGIRERQRRKRNGIQGQVMPGRRSSICSGSYEMHAQIFEAYAYLDNNADISSLDGSEDDEDVESYAPLSTLASRSVSSLLEMQKLERDNDADGDANTLASQEDVIETPVNHVNRGTFGYYDLPMVQSPRSHQGSNGIYAYDYIPSDGETDAQSREWRNISADYGDVTQDMTPLREEEDALEDQDSDCDCPGDVSIVTGPPRSSSLYYRASSPDTPCDESDGCAGLRASRQPLVPRTLNSDSESDCAHSSSSASLTASMSTAGSASTCGIGLAILSPEQFAHFNACDFIPACSSPECEEDDDLEGSPTTLACTSSPPQSQRHFDDIECGIDGLSTSSDRLQTSLAKLQTQHPYAEGRAPQYTARFAFPALKPALHIKSNSNATSAMAEQPSPTDTVATYPPHAYALPKGTPGRRADPFADEAEQPRSFMHLSPEDSPPRLRSLVRLPRLFSRANLKATSGRKSEAASKF
ncbi:hypothetical protein DFH11DRAFT_1782295 [Phellopilus nigrolimitatus]|nr:hypothetical protein DFH11DRAFT_1782295 [Phellopilus nigrolimitatus]